MNRIDQPRPGHYKRRLVRNGPWVPVRIWFHTGERDEAGDLLEDEGLRCELNGKRADPYEQWVGCAGYPISKSEFEHMLNVKHWAEENAIDQPEANPRRPIDLGRMKPLF